MGSLVKERGEGEEGGGSRGEREGREEREEGREGERIRGIVEGRKCSYLLYFYDLYHMPRVV